MVITHSEDILATNAMKYVRIHNSDAKLLYKLTIYWINANVAVTK